MTYYSIVRYCIIAVLFILIYVLFKKNKALSRFLHYRRRTAIIAVIAIYFLISTALYVIPFENAFVTFSSLESAYSYYNTEPLSYVVEGQCSDLVISQKDATSTLNIVKKESTGWKIGKNLDLRTVKLITFDGGMIRLRQYKNTDDFYISIDVTVTDNNGAPSITDNNSTEFLELSHIPNDTNTQFYGYYGYIHNYGEWYEISVNGLAIELN